VSVTDAAGNVVTATYDVGGRKIASNDPDLGAWTYAYDTANELVSQTDAKSQTSTLSYDKIGRLTQRVEPDMTSVWVYDTAANGIGKVASASITAGPSAGYQRSFAYDTLTRPTQATVTVGGTGYTFAATYDGNSPLSGVTYPSGLALNYTYTSLGYAQRADRRPRRPRLLDRQHPRRRAAPDPGDRRQRRRHRPGNAQRLGYGGFQRRL
jgi:YD repeat-containing protein